MQKISIEFYHGRKDPKQQLDDWGEKGPVVNIDWFICTYKSHMRIGADGEECDIPFFEDLVKIGEDCYGDFSIQEYNENGVSFVEFLKLMK